MSYGPCIHRVRRSNGECPVCHQSNLDLNSDVNSSATDMSATVGRVFQSLNDICLTGSQALQQTEPSHRGKRPIHDAAAAGQLDLVRRMLNDDPESVNAIMNTGETPLHLSCMNGFLEVVKEIVNSGSNVKALTKPDGKLPIHIAAENGHKPVVEYLVDEVQIELEFEKDCKGRIAFLLAARNGQSEVVKFFLDKTFVSIENCDNDQKTALHHASEEGQFAVVDLLLSLKYQASTKARDKKGNTALHLAVQNGHYRVIEMLNEADASVIEMTNIDGKSPIQCTLSSRLDITQLLDRAKSLVPVQKKSFHKVTVLTMGPPDSENTMLHQEASKADNLEKVMRLVESNPSNLRAISNHGLLPIHIATESGHLDYVKYFIRKDQLLAECRTFYLGMLPIHCAAAKGHDDIVEYFVKECKIDIDVSTNNGRTPLHLSCANGCFVVVEYLLGRNADIRKKSGSNDKSSLPVHLAADNGHLDIVKMLLQHDRDLETATDDDGATPFHRSGSVEVSRYFLKDKNHSVDTKCSTNQATPLLCAASKGFVDVINSLIDCGADTGAKTYPDCNNALHLAAFSGHLDAVKYLLDNKRCFRLKNMRNRDGQRPVEYASKNFELSKTCIDYLHSRR